MKKSEKSDTKIKINGDYFDEDDLQSNYEPIKKQLKKRRSI